MERTNFWKRGEAVIVKGAAFCIFRDRRRPSSAVRTAKSTLPLRLVRMDPLQSNFLACFMSPINQCPANVDVP
jgi:hypothetical protein